MYPRVLQLIKSGNNMAKILFQQNIPDPGGDVSPNYLNYDAKRAKRNIKDAVPLRRCSGVGQLRENTSF